MSGVLLWESCVLPFLLNNCSTWYNIQNKDIIRLTKVQNLFLNVLLGVRNCPAALMLWDLCILSIPHRILKEKLILYHHLSCLPVGALGRQVLEQQQHLQMPGLHEEVAGFLKKHEIINIQAFSKSNWKSFVKNKLSIANREFIIEWSKKYKKLDYLSLGCEDYERKSYLYKLSLAQARIKFRERSKTMNTCRTQFPSDVRNFKAKFECFHCDNIDTLNHWRTCEAYSHLRQSKNPIIKMRANINEQ